MPEEAVVPGSAPIPTEIMMPEQASIIDMMFGSGPVVQLVLYILIFLSIWSWAITISKFLQFRRAKSHSEQFRNIFWETRNLARIDDSTRRLDGSPLAKLFVAGYRELTHVLQEGKDAPVNHAGTDLSTVEQALRRAQLEESFTLERGVTFLATVASAAPFIGLFGTVWGIMNSFHGLSSAKSTTLQAVAPGISEALIATAIGLAAAIPAAVAYNYLSTAIRRFRQSMDNFVSEFLNIAERYFIK
jgi:biopolymer transport protein TolQ